MSQDENATTINSHLFTQFICPPQFHTDSQSSTQGPHLFSTQNPSVQHTLQFHTKNFSVQHQKPFSSTHSLVPHRKLISSNPFSSTPKTPQLHTVFVWGVCWSEGFLVWNWRVFGVELKGVLNWVVFGM